MRYLKDCTARTLLRVNEVRGKYTPAVTTCKNENTKLPLLVCAEGETFLHHLVNINLYMYLPELNILNRRGDIDNRFLVLAVVGAALVSGCTHALPRAEKSPYACMAAVRDSLPADIPDARKHCLAAAGIALRCSVVEAGLASVGKELKDFFGKGDASVTDLRADRAGARCAGAGHSPDALNQCCIDAGY
jgi:hypothetical protein